MYICLWDNSRGHPDNVSFMQRTKRFTGLWELIQLLWTIPIREIFHFHHLPKLYFGFNVILLLNLSSLCLVCLFSSYMLLFYTNLHPCYYSPDSVWLPVLVLQSSFHFLVFKTWNIPTASLKLLSDWIHHTLWFPSIFFLFNSHILLLTQKLDSHFLNSIDFGMFPVYKQSTT